MYSHKNLGTKLKIEFQDFLIFRNKLNKFLNLTVMVNDELTADGILHSSYMISAMISSSLFIDSMHVYVFLPF